MIKKAIIYTIFFICTLPTISNAQNIGFLGKHLSVFYNLDHSPFGFDFQDDEYYDSGNKSNFLGIQQFLRFRHRVNIDYAIKRNLSIGLYGIYSRGGLGRVNLGFTSNYTSPGIGVSFKFFSYKKGGIAPLGTYWGINILRTQFTGFDIGDESIYGKNHIVNKKSDSTYSFGIEIGKNQVLFKEFLFNVAVHLNLPAELSYLGGDYDGSLNDYVYSDWVQRQLIMFTFGIGLCPI